MRPVIFILKISMDTGEIEALVKIGAEMPENLSTADCYYFLSLDYIRKVKLPALKKRRLRPLTKGIRKSNGNYIRKNQTG